MMPASTHLAPLGESALTITLGDRISLETHLKVCALCERIRSARFPGLEEVVPGYATITLHYDPLTETFETLTREVERLLVDGAPSLESTATREHSIPVYYDGPDLAYVADQTGLSVSEVIARHSKPLYRVYLMGFVPGFGYLGDLDPALALPRRGTPRRRVPAGSVAIGGAQTGVYPLDTPGGWHLVGRTDLKLFDPDRGTPILLAVGDRVRFIPLGP
jgi:inhibitor of KinA